MHFVYIVRCADGTLYTGYARDPLTRERAHNMGRGAKYTSGRRPVRLVYQEAFRSMRKALVCTLEQPAVTETDRVQSSDSLPTRAITSPQTVPFGCRLAKASLRRDVRRGSRARR